MKKASCRSVPKTLDVFYEKWECGQNLRVTVWVLSIEPFYVYPNWVVFPCLFHPQSIPRRSLQPPTLMCLELFQANGYNNHRGGSVCAEFDPAAVVSWTQKENSVESEPLWSTMQIRQVSTGWNGDLVNFMGDSGTPPYNQTSTNCQLLTCHLWGHESHECPQDDRMWQLKLLTDRRPCPDHQT